MGAFFRHVAQGLEHYLDMVGVVGSIPIVPTRINYITFVPAFLFFDYLLQDNFL